MQTKTFSKIAATLALTFFTMIANANITINGTITSATGALALLTPVGTAYSGDFTFNSGLEYGLINLSGFCFSTTAVSLPPTSADCAGTSSTVPVLARDTTAYTGETPAPGTLYDQAGSTFDGASGTVNILAFSPSFNLNITINVVFNADGTGTMIANAGILGTAMGTLTWQ